MKRSRIAAALGVVLLLSAAGCSQQHEDKRGRGDAPVAQRKGDDSPAFCTNMPDEFGNVCTKCIAHFPPWAVTVTTHYQSSANIAVFQAPEQCGGKVVAGAPPAVVGSASAAIDPDEDD